MYKVLSFVMACVILVSSIGCTATQFNSTINTISKEIPAAEALASDLSTLITGDPLSNPIYTKAGTLGTTDLTLVSSAVAAYEANKTSGNKAAIFAAVTTLASDINAQVLAANLITNSASQKAALTKLTEFAAVVNGFQLVLAPFFNTSEFHEAVPFNAVAAYISQDEKERVAQVYGYHASDIQAITGGIYGF